MGNELVSNTSKGLHQWEDIFAIFLYFIVVVGAGFWVRTQILFFSKLQMYLDNLVTNLHTLQNSRIE